MLPRRGNPTGRGGLLAALGFLALALGLFVIPHDAGPAQLFREAANAAQAGHTRSMVGLTLIVVGLLAAIVGSLGSSRRRA